MLSHQERTSYQEPAQIAAQEVGQTPSAVPRWAIALFGSGVLGLTAGWVYLLALWVHSLWHHLIF